MAPVWPSIVGEGTGASDCQGVEAPWLLALAQTRHSHTETRNQKIPGSGSQKGRERQGDRYTDGPVTSDPKGPDRDLSAGREIQQGRERTREQQ